jgi:hypothetical protein
MNETIWCEIGERLGQIAEELELTGNPEDMFKQIVVHVRSGVYTKTTRGLINEMKGFLRVPQLGSDDFANSLVEFHNLAGGVMKLKKLAEDLPSLHHFLEAAYNLGVELGVKNIQNELKGTAEVVECLQTIIDHLKSRIEKYR